MRHRIICSAIICIVVILSGCGVPQGNNALAATEYWRVQVDDFSISPSGYSVSLYDGSVQNTLDIILDIDGEKQLVATVDFEVAVVDQIHAAAFSDLLGYNGFVLQYDLAAGTKNQYFIMEDYTPVCLINEVSTQDYSVDLDGDGITELVNIYIGGTGGQQAEIFRHTPEGISHSFVSDLGTFEDGQFVGPKVCSTYDEKRKVFKIWSYSFAKQCYILTEIVPDLDAMEWELIE